jgi:hypothetical protein
MIIAPVVGPHPIAPGNPSIPVPPLTVLYPYPFTSSTTVVAIAVIGRTAMLTTRHVTVQNLLKPNRLTVHLLDS